jgi:hypothetical protein
MRYFYIILSMLMLLFAGVQYNDPDGLLWAIIYLIPGSFAAISAWRPDLLGGGVGQLILLTAIVAAIGATIYYWPATDEFWRVSVWWKTETAREGMGAMISLLVLLVSYAGTRKSSFRA